MFTHIDANGNASMVDVSKKNDTLREAHAEGTITLNKEIIRAILENTNKKGDVLSTSKIAGIQAAKKTSELKAREKFVLSISENGYGKRTSHTDYRVTNRGGKGIIGIVNSPRNGNITSSFPVFEGDEILISTNKGRVIRVAVKEIRTAGRNTQGVRIIKLSGEEKVVSAIKIDDNLF